MASAIHSGRTKGGGDNRAARYEPLFGGEYDKVEEHPLASRQPSHGMTRAMRTESLLAPRPA